MLPAVKLPLQWKWFFGLVALLTALLVLTIVGIDVTLPPYLVHKIQEDLERDVHLMQYAFTGPVTTTPVSPAQINVLAHDLGQRTGLRITVIAPDGVVWGESSPDHQPNEMENHLRRPEVQQALHTGLGSNIRHSHTLGVDLMYVATVVRTGEPTGPVRAIVRVALPLHQIAQTTSRVRRTVAIVGIVVGLIAVPFLFWLARRYSRPIETMRQMAARVASGDFHTRAPERIGGELGELADALNQMSHQLETRLRELANEKAELTAILSGMTEGVLVVDAGGRIRLMNQALRQQFQLGDEATGKTVLEALRNVELEQLIAVPSAKEMTVLTPTERVFVVNAAALRNRAGTVVVFHDITRLKKLENLRKEFVANVSHELRTPLSIIKGYIETLLEEPAPDAAIARQFLQTIQKNSRRLETLIEDLLSISALESQQAQLTKLPVTLASAAAAAVEELSRQARAKSQRLTVNLPASLPAVAADPQRLHQIIINLLDNAIKYTQPGGQITLSARPVEHEVEVCVSDNGPGIAAEHLPHIFERFYRVDKARSRELGGTGLGLSIVKHIVQAHGGRVWVESAVGQGSAFYFSLPRA